MSAAPTNSSPIVRLTVYTPRTAADTPNSAGIISCSAIYILRFKGPYAALRGNTHLVELLRVVTSNYEQNVAADVHSDGLVVTENFSDQRKEFRLRQELVDTHEAQQPL